MATDLARSLLAARRVKSGVVAELTGRLEQAALKYPTYISTVLLRDGSGLILLNPDHIWSSMTHLLKEGYSYKLGFESVVH